jgi:urease beta subunit
MIPGEYLLETEPIEANSGREAVTVTIRSVGDRPIQVGSHYHFFEVNRALQFDRASAYGMRLNIPAGTASRFEPGEEKQVVLVPIGGARRIFGHNGLVEGALDDPAVHQRAMERLAQFLGAPAGKGE